MPRRPLQFSLAALLGVMVALCVLLAYLHYWGVTGIALAIGPPILFGGLVNGMIAGHLPPDFSPSRTKNEAFPDDVRAMLLLVLGFAIWIPIYCAIVFS